MAVERILLDTDILIEIMRGRDPVVKANKEDYLAVHDQYTLTAVTVVELVAGLRRPERSSTFDELTGIFESAEIISLDYESALLAGQIHGDLQRAGLPIGIVDPMIAGIAITHGLALCTGNRRHFERAGELGYPLRIVDWREPPRVPR